MCNISQDFHLPLVIKDHCTLMQVIAHKHTATIYNQLSTADENKNAFK